MSGHFQIEQPIHPVGRESSKCVFKSSHYRDFPLSTRAGIMIGKTEYRFNFTKVYLKRLGLP
jgi:hypothetical protein